MKKFAEHLFEINQHFCQEVPPMVKTHDFIDDLLNLIFPIRMKKDITQKEIDTRLEDLKTTFIELLSPLKPNMEKDPEEVANVFFDTLPEIYFDLLDDAEVYFKSDPAAYCTEEIILCYPGYYAVCIYRLAHLMYDMKVPVLPRVISEHAHSKTGIDINPGAQIGKHFYIDHGTGVVVGETAEIGNNVKLYQGVTLGAMYVEKSMSHKKRHPTIQNNVIVYAGGTILGGNTVVGHDTVIGGNVWLTESVQPFSVVYRRPRIHIRDSKEFNEPINFTI